MIGTDRIRTLQNEVARYPLPVLSLYLDVDPSRPENARKAYALRARAALRALGLPKSYIRSLLARLRLDHGVPEARTVAVFAGEEPERLFESFMVRPVIPQVAAHQGVVARWGEPYVAPLLLALSEHPRYLGVLLESNNARLFELFLDEIEELPALEQPLDYSQWRPLREHSTGAPGVPARGGSGKDLFDKRVADWRRRFHKDVALRVAQEVEGRDTCRLMLMGLEPEIHAFEAALPPALQARVHERLAPPANPEATASALHPLFLEAAARVEDELERSLLDRIRERGVWGFGPTLEAVDEGRVRTLAVPWHLDASVVRCAGGRVVASLAEAAHLCPDAERLERPLADVLPALAERHGMEFVVLHGENETRLQRDFDGLAGLARW